MKTTLKIRFILTIGLFLVFTSSYAQMTHPGGWFTADDLTLIRTKVSAGEEPWISGWKITPIYSSCSCITWLCTRIYEYFSSWNGNNVF